MYQTGNNLYREGAPGKSDRNVLKPILTGFSQSWPGVCLGLDTQIDDITDLTDIADLTASTGTDRMQKEAKVNRGIKK
ncbi:hypothetical protein [Paraburkholderia sp. J67]|uniref:hypothetical protein n=1 Tax=Paraburkholderia sp. J67 TaxID=2805435 RepID=UPI002ABE0728|nr:hypothetical protein [Paraburkholderia sp. J67]